MFTLAISNSFVAFVEFIWLHSVMSFCSSKLRVRYIRKFILSLWIRFLQPYIFHFVINKYSQFVVISQALFWQQPNYYGVDLTPLHGTAFQGYFSQVGWTHNKQLITCPWSCLYVFPTNLNFNLEYSFLHELGNFLWFYLLLISYDYPNSAACGGCIWSKITGGLSIDSYYRFH